MMRHTKEMTCPTLPACVISLVGQVHLTYCGTEETTQLLSHSTLAHLFVPRPPPVSPQYRTECSIADGGVVVIDEGGFHPARYFVKIVVSANGPGS